MRHSLAIALIASIGLMACGKDQITTPTNTPPRYLRIKVATVGGDIDQDGYSLTVDSHAGIAIGVQGSVIVDGLGEGPHSVTIDGIADNCVLSGPPNLTVMVAATGLTDAQFNVTCSATGISLTTHTTGRDLPPGFGLTMNGDGAGGVGTNAKATFSRMAPGTYKVAISLVNASNCRVTSDNPASVSVTNRTMTQVSMEVACVQTEKRIVFVLDSIFTPWIAATNTTGSVTALLTQGDQPTWSADGSIFFSNLYCYDYYGTYCNGGIGVFNTNTYEATFPAYGRLSSYASSSPDGRSVVFAKIIDSVSLDERLFILGPDSAVKLLDTHGNSLSARWSPDGSRLVFQCDRPKIEAICVVNVDGTGLLQLSDDRYVTRSPEWSPDGTQIAFATNQFASANSPYQQDIAIMNANGSGARRLATGFDPAWSPDGSMLVYAGNNGLFTIRADGSNSTRLTTGSHHAPAWR